MRSCLLPPLVLVLIPCSAYEKAIDMEEDHLFELNYAITLALNEQLDKARLLLWRLLLWRLLSLFHTWHAT